MLPRATENAVSGSHLVRGSLIAHPCLRVLFFTGKGFLSIDSVSRKMLFYFVSAEGIDSAITHKSQIACNLFSR